MTTDEMAALDAHMERREWWRRRIRQSAMILASWVVAFTPVWWRWLPW